MQESREPEINYDAPALEADAHTLSTGDVCTYPTGAGNEPGGFGMCYVVDIDADTDTVTLRLMAENTTLALDAGDVCDALGVTIIPTGDSF